MKVVDRSCNMIFFLIPPRSIATRHLNPRLRFRSSWHTHLSHHGWKPHGSNTHSFDLPEVWVALCRAVREGAVTAAAEEVGAKLLAFEVIISHAAFGGSGFSTRSQPRHFERTQLLSHRGQAGRGGSLVQPAKNHPNPITRHIYLTAGIQGSVGNNLTKSLTGRLKTCL